MQEFVILYFRQFMDDQNSFDNFLSGGSLECATKYMGVISQNAFPLITASPSGGNLG